MMNYFRINGAKIVINSEIKEDSAHFTHYLYIKNLSHNPHFPMAQIPGLCISAQEIQCLDVWTKVCFRGGDLRERKKRKRSITT